MKQGDFSCQDMHQSTAMSTSCDSNDVNCNVLQTFSTVMLRVV